MPGKNTYDNVIREVLMSVPPTTARVPPDSVSDVYPIPVEPDVGDETMSPVEPLHGPFNLYNREIDRRVSGEGWDDTKAMLDAIERRQKLGRSE